MNIQDVKKNLGRRVVFNGSDCYELTGCIIRKDAKSGQFFYQAELADLTCGKAIVYCGLDAVESKEVQK